VRFGLGGTGYQIDLSTSNATAFRAQPRPLSSTPAGRAGGSRERSSDIRAWAKDQGITVSGRGRIPASVAGQYDAATQGA
jgi:hypothetical protein